MRVYVAHFAVVTEEQWFGSPRAHASVRIERRGHVQSQLFVATDADDAFRIATEWLAGFDDANHDGPGDLTIQRGIGLHQLEEVLSSSGALLEAVNDLYGLDVGTIHPDDVDADDIPRVRAKGELDIFRCSG